VHEYLFVTVHEEDHSIKISALFIIVTVQRGLHDTYQKILFVILHEETRYVLVHNNNQSFSQK
jgi:hypothetical protein